MKHVYGEVSGPGVRGEKNSQSMIISDQNV